VTGFRVKRPVLAAQALEAAVRQAAASLGLGLLVSWSQSGRSATTHWRFAVGEREILHWWPGTSRWWAPVGGRRGRADGPWQALAVAAALAAAAGQIPLPGAQEAGSA
jgi:hypothetical protein